MPHSFLLTLTLLFTLLLPAMQAQPPVHDINALILSEIANMPKGGGYAITAEASRNLRTAIRLDQEQGGDRFRVTPHGATPSYCSGATYLVFLKTLLRLEESRQLQLPSALLSTLLVQGQPDGTGIWGRWNANGPGTARLFHEIQLGRNFDRFEHARPGDFMKIFWTREVGQRERGHSVIYLGSETRNGVESVRFWSSNQPDGYGEKTIPRSKIAYALFSRLESPAAIVNAPKLPRTDPYLATLLSKRSSIAEARAKSGVR